LPPLDPFSIAAQVTGHAAGRLTVRELDLTLGDVRYFKVKVTGEISSVHDLRELDFNLELHASNLSQLTTFMPAVLLALPQFSVGGLRRGTWASLPLRT
jgi:hypothetical protein